MVTLVRPGMVGRIGASLSTGDTIIPGTKFDGTNDFFLLDGVLTGAAAAKVGTFFMWFKRDEAGIRQDPFIIMQDDGGFVLEMIINADNTILVRSFTSGGGDAHAMVTTTTVTNDGDWHSYLGSWNLGSAGSKRIYIDDVEDTNPAVVYNDVTIKYDEMDFMGVGTEMDLNMDSSNGRVFNGCIAQFWLSMDTYVDSDVAANRHKFIREGNLPILHPTSGVINGITPVVWLSRPADSFGTNDGSGQNFTEDAGSSVIACTTPLSG